MYAAGGHIKQIGLDAKDEYEYFIFSLICVFWGSSVDMERHFVCMHILIHNG